MTFSRNIQNTPDTVYMLQFSCRFACYHVVVSLKLHSENNACMVLLEIVRGDTQAQSGVPWPSHTLTVALDTGQLRRR